MDTTNQAEFTATVAASLVHMWPVTITIAVTAVRLAVGKSSTSIRRRPAEQGVGFVRRSEASFLFPQALSVRPDVGTQFTLTTTDVVAEQGTTWRVYALNRGESGAPDRAECYKLES
jgi:hypothetical protein